MSVKLAYLKTGEQVLADIKELVDENEKVVSLLFSNPYIVKFLTPELLFEGYVNEFDNEVEHRVSFSPWIVLSADKDIPVNPDWVISIVEPIEWVKNSYIQKMNVSTSDGVVDEDLKPSTINEQLIENFEVMEEETNG
jgi:hypothetical protein